MIAGGVLRAYLIAALMFGAAAALAQDDLVDLPLVAGIEGVPLMLGLVELADDTVVFDKPEGRIIDATVSGAVLLSDAYAYYHSALIETGWTPLLRKVIDGILVVRGGEVLHLRFRREADETAVHFSLSPYEKE